MTATSLRRALGKIGKLETRFGVDPGSHDASPTLSDVIFKMLLAGECECALKWLDMAETEVFREWRSLKREGRPEIDTNFTDLAQLRQTLNASCAGAPWDTRETIARKLLAADSNGSRPHSHFDG